MSRTQSSPSWFSFHWNSLGERNSPPVSSSPVVRMSCLSRKTWMDLLGPACTLRRCMFPWEHLATISTGCLEIPSCFGNSHLQPPIILGIYRGCSTRRSERRRDPFHNGSPRRSHKYLHHVLTPGKGGPCQGSAGPRAKMTKEDVGWREKMKLSSIGKYCVEK